MNRGQMVDELSFVLNFNENQVSQDFSASRLRKALQWGYETVVRMAKIEGQKRWFKKNGTYTWASGVVRLALPNNFHQKSLLALWDATQNSPGFPLQVREGFDDGELFWYDNRTLQWGTQGPAADKTIFVEYLAEPEVIPVSTDFDAAEYDLVPPGHHWLIIYEAAVFLKEIADENVPQRIVTRLEEARHDYWKFLSLGRPFSDPATINDTWANNSDDITGFLS